MKKLFDPEEYDRQVIQDHIRFLRAKKQVEDFNKQQKRTLGQLNSTNYEHKLLFNQDPSVRADFSKYLQSSSNYGQNNASIVQQLINRDVYANNSMKRKRDQLINECAQTEAASMDLDEEDQHLSYENNDDSDHDIQSDGFVPNKRRKIQDATNVQNISVNNNAINLANTNANNTELSSYIGYNKKRKASEPSTSMEIENEIETKRRRID
jgi:hypothetical protein